MRIADCRGNVLVVTCAMLILPSWEFLYEAYQQYLLVICIKHTLCLSVWLHWQTLLMVLLF